jgi:hypothetical protein
VHFRLTSSGVMNSFFVPQLGSQIYTMEGMTSQVSLQADQVGTYAGLSAQSIRAVAIAVLAKPDRLARPPRPSRARGNRRKLVNARARPECTWLKRPLYPARNCGRGYSW